MGELPDRMREDLILKGYSSHTQNGYLRCARTLARHFMRSPERAEWCDCCHADSSSVCGALIPARAMAIKWSAFRLAAPTACAWRRSLSVGSLQKPAFVPVKPVLLPARCYFDNRTICPLIRCIFDFHRREVLVLPMNEYCCHICYLLF
jgi:hypothetical protein